MKLRERLLAVVLIISVVGIQARAATVTVSIHNEPAVPVPVHFADGEWRIGTPGSEFFIHETGQGKIMMVGALDPDPMISFGGVVTDFGAASDFSFTYILPLAPTFSNPSSVKDSFSASFTNATGPNFAVTANPPPAGIPTDGGVEEMQVFTLSDDGGLTWQNVGLDLGPSAAYTLPAGDSGDYGPFNEGFIPTIAGGPWTHMRADVNFELTGGGDIFTFNGAKTLVPEPGTLALLLLSLGVCGLSRRSAVR